MYFANVFSKSYLLYLLDAVPNGLGWKYIGYGCSGAKHNSYNEVTYSGKDNFIGAVKLVHRSGYVGCYASAHSNWGCAPWRTDIFTVVTDVKNQVMYPAPRISPLQGSGWYKLPGFTSSSPELVLSDFGHPTYLTHGTKLRIWYAEDLLGKTESDNHGRTCYQVYVYIMSA